MVPSGMVTSASKCPTLQFEVAVASGVFVLGGGSVIEGVKVMAGPTVIGVTLGRVNPPEGGPVLVHRKQR